MNFIKALSLFMLIFIFDSVRAQGSLNSNIEFCEQEFSKSMYQLLQDDKHDLLSDYYNLASYKMAFVMAEGGAENQTLERFIKDKAKFIKANDKAKLISKVKSLYHKFGKDKDLNRITEIIDNLDEHSYFPASKRLSNQESSVVLLAFNQMQTCSEVCISEDDAAITWFMDEVSRKVKQIQKDSEKTNLIQMSVKIAHLNGAIGTKKAIDKTLLKYSIGELSHNIQEILSRHKDEFFEKFTQCRDLLVNKCFQRVLKSTFPKTLSKILEDIKKNQISQIDEDLKLKLVDGVKLNLVDPLRTELKEVEKVKKSKDSKKSFLENFPSLINLPAKIVTPENQTKMCGGKEFRQEIKNVELWSFDPLRVARNAKTIRNEEKELGLISALCEIAKAGPIGMHCYTFIKKFVLRRKTNDVSVCCNDEVQWKDMVSLYASIGGGAEIKAYLGVPFLRKLGVVAEVGLMGGASMGFSLGGGDTPEKCTSRICAQAAVRTGIYLGGYIEVGLNKSKKLNSKALDTLNKLDVAPASIAKGLRGKKNKNGADFSLVGGELKLSFKPYVSGRQCFYPKEKLPPAEIKLSLGSVWMHGTIHFGWMFSKDIYELVYKNDIEDTFSIPIF